MLNFDFAQLSSIIIHNDSSRCLTLTLAHMHKEMTLQAIGCGRVMWEVTCQHMAMHTPQLLCPWMPPHALHTCPTHGCPHACSSTYGHALYQQAHLHAHPPFIHMHTCPPICTPMHADLPSTWGLFCTWFSFFLLSSSTSDEYGEKEFISYSGESHKILAIFFFFFFEMIVVLIRCRYGAGHGWHCKQWGWHNVVGGHMTNQALGPLTLPAQGLVLYSCSQQVWNSAASPILSVVLSAVVLWRVRSARNVSPAHIPCTPPHTPCTPPHTPCTPPHTPCTPPHTP